MSVIIDWKSSNNFSNKILKNISAIIYTISNNGIITVKFNQKLVIPLNVTNFNNDIILISIIPKIDVNAS